MKTVMKMYIVKGSIVPGEESEVEKNETKENHTTKKDLSTYLTTGEKAQWGEVAPRNQGRRKGPPENMEHEELPHSTPEKQADVKGNN